jgi:hypothetical protein
MTKIERTTATSISLEFGHTIYRRGTFDGVSGILVLVLAHQGEGNDRLLDWVCTRMNKTTEHTRRLSPASVCCVAAWMTRRRRCGRESFLKDIYIIYTLHIIPLTRSKAKHSSALRSQ